MNFGRKLKAVCWAKRPKTKPLQKSKQSTVRVCGEAAPTDSWLCPTALSLSTPSTEASKMELEERSSITDVDSTPTPADDQTKEVATEPGQTALIENLEASVSSEEPNHTDAVGGVGLRSTLPDGGQPSADEDVVWITPDQAQALRDQEYIDFDGEDETDYTKGPIRFVLTSDGVEQCCAVLMTLPLSTKIQVALHAQRTFDKEEKDLERRIEALRNLLVEVNKHRVNLRFQMDSTQRAAKKDEHGSIDIDRESEDHPNELNPEQRAMTQKLAVLDSMYEHHEDRVKALKSTIEVKKRWVLQTSRAAVAEMEEAWIHAQLMAPNEAPDESPVQDLDLNEEYEKHCQWMQEGDDQFSGGAAPLEADPEAWVHQLAPPMTEEQEQWERLKSIVYWSLERFQKAFHQFEHRETQRLAELRANLDAGSRGEETTDDSPEAFDIRWFKRNQELTRELIDAEAGWLEAKVAAAEAGLRVELNDQAPDFGVDGDDGYRMSQEQNMIDSVPSPTIRNWVSEIPDLASPSFNDRFVESDSWNVQEVDISDSVSLVATGNDRRRIERWQKLCGW